jgi:hypothetical protein
MTMTRCILATLLAALAIPASAQSIYRCTDANGGTLISNTRVDKSCKPVVTGPDSSIPAPKAKPGGAAANSTPGNFPRVQEDTQKARDTDRKHILEQELASEQRSLEQARRDLAEIEATRNPDGSPPPPDRLQPYRDRVSQHERNIGAIQKEMGNLR